MEDFYDFCKYLILSPVNFLLDMHLTVKITPINIEQALFYCIGFCSNVCYFDTFCVEIFHKMIWCYQKRESRFLSPVCEQM